MLATFSRPPAEIEILRHVERVEHIEPAIGVGRAQRDGAVRDRVARRTEEDPGPGNGVIGLHGSELGAGAEIGHAVVEAAAEDEVIAVAEQLVRAGGLDCRPDARRLGRGAVDFAERRVGRKGIRQLLAVQAVGGRDGVVEAQQSVRIAGSVSAGLRVGRVAIDGGLIERAGVGRGLQRPGRRKGRHWRSRRDSRPDYARSAGFV